MEGHEGDTHGVVTEHKGEPRHSENVAGMAKDEMAMDKTMAGSEEEDTGMAMDDMGHMEKPADGDWYPKTYNPYKPVYDTFTINGRAFPYTQPLEVKKGERVRIRIVNAGYEPHFMHTHAHKFEVVAIDGNRVPGKPQVRDTVQISPGSRVDIILKADNPGVWPFHCHNLLHIANDNIYPGGMLTFIRYVE